MRLGAFWVILCLFLSGCAGAVPPTRLAQGSLGHVLRLRPYLSSSPTVQALVGTKTVEDIHYLYLLPMIERADGAFCFLSSVTGEPLDPSGAYDWGDAVHAFQRAPMIQLGRPIQLSGLKANGHYRIVAVAFDRAQNLVSVPASSILDLTLSNDDAPSVDAPIPLKLMDTVFGASLTLRLSATGQVSRLDHLEVRLKRMGDELLAPLPVASFSIAAEDLAAPLRLSHLNARSRYRVEIEAFMRDAGPAPASQSFEVLVDQDDQLPDRTVAVAIP